jgi:hypothetical protein
VKINLLYLLTANLKTKYQGNTADIFIRRPLSIRPGGTGTSSLKIEYVSCWSVLRAHCALGVLRALVEKPQVHALSLRKETASVLRVLRVLLPEVFWLPPTRVAKHSSARD